MTSVPPIDPFGSGAEPLAAMVLAVDGWLLAVAALALAVLAGLAAVTRPEIRLPRRSRAVGGASVATARGLG